MTTLAEIKNNRTSFLRVIVGFLPLAFGFFLSVLFRTLDSQFPDDLMTDLGIGEDTLGTMRLFSPLSWPACCRPASHSIDLGRVSSSR